jgi:pimeloyl-ACP methyl ester carboxylesterase
MVHLDWISPKKNESLKEYALRLADKIDASKPFALVGLSLGGMIAAEIAKKYKPEACILLCSVPTHKHLPIHFKWAYFLRIHKLLPVPVVKKVSMLNRGLTDDNKDDQQILRQVIKDSDPAFISWAIHAALSWKNEVIPPSLWHIHGAKDRLFPIRFTNPTHRVPEGNHMMIMSKAAEMNNFLKEVLEKINSKK